MTEALQDSICDLCVPDMKVKLSAAERQTTVVWTWNWFANSLHPLVLTQKGVSTNCMYTSAYRNDAQALLCQRGQSHRVLASSCTSYSPVHLSFCYSHFFGFLHFEFQSSPKTHPWGHSLAPYLFKQITYYSFQFQAVEAQSLPLVYLISSHGKERNQSYFDVSC